MAHCSPTSPLKGTPRSQGLLLPVSYCMQDYLGTQVSTNIRQPDLVFFKNVLIHSFSFSYSEAANDALKKEVQPGQLLQLHLPWSALPSILHASPTLGCNGGNLQEKGAMDGQWRWEQLSQVHFIWVDPQLCQTNAANTSKLQQDVRSQSLGFLAETRPWGPGWAIQLAGRGGQEDPNSSSQHQSVYTQQEFSEVREEDRTANYCHCVPTGGHPCLPAHRSVFR